MKNRTFTAMHSVDSHIPNSLQGTLLAFLSQGLTRRDVRALELVFNHNPQKREVGV